MSAKVSPQILLRLRPRIVGLNGGRGWQGLLSRLLFRGIAAKPRASLGIEGELITSNALLELFCQFKSPSMILLGGIKTPK